MPVTNRSSAEATRQMWGNGNRRHTAFHLHRLRSRRARPTGLIQAAGNGAAPLATEPETRTSRRHRLFASSEGPITFYIIAPHTYPPIGRATVTAIRVSTRKLVLPKPLTP